MPTPRVIIAGLRGGDGKTLVTIGLQAAWRERGYRVAPLKKGPDYIDAAWATAAAGRPCRNLDLFLLERDTVLRSFGRAAVNADVTVIEGNRGLYDGLDARGSCSTAELAKHLRAPVVLVVDCTKATRTIAASVLGCQRLDPDVPIRGVVLNRTSGGRHESVISDAVEDATGLPVLGALPRLSRDIIPERHLGLLPPAEHAGRDDVVREAAGLIERHLDLDGVLALARQAPQLHMPAADPAVFPRAQAAAAASPSSQRAEVPTAELADEARTPRIGIFRDEAFQFYYPENLEALVDAGAQLREISPLREARLPDVDALYIGGGFPETLATALAENGSLRESVRRGAEAGLPIYAECGGAIFLGETLSFRGGRYPMAGVLPVSFGFRERAQGHGYTVLETVAENAFYPMGSTLRGHEFHHTCMEPATAELTFAFRVRRGEGFGEGRDGLCRRNVLACYTHVHALGVKEWAPSLVRAGVRFRAQAARAGATV